jgi:hypothetical protein
MDRPENPPAFPREDYQADDAPGQRDMTLRDWFAGQAPPAPEHFCHPGYPGAYIADHEWTQEKQDAADAAVSAWLSERAAAWSFAFADAMLAARTQSKEGRE